MSETRGVLLYAMNTKQVDYGKIANIAALLIDRHLGLPVSVVTDNPISVDIGLFDQIIHYNPRQDKALRFDDPNTDWRNKERDGYYDHSPYDATLVIDSDYLLFSSELLKLFDTDQDLYLSFNALRTNGGLVNDTELRISPYGLDQVWATCFYFRKTPITKAFFNLVSYVREHFDYYAHQYDFDAEKYRNDFTFSVAHHLFTSGTPGVVGKNPFPILTAYPSTRIQKVQEDGLVLIGPAEVNKIHFHQRTSVHMLNKETILDAYPRFKELFL